MKLHVDLRKEEKNSAIRKEGNIPAVIYGKHMDAALSITCKKNDFIKKFKEAGYSTPLTLEGDGVDQFVLIHDMQLDPVSDVVLHVDFLAVNKNEKVTTEVPVILIGESPIEKIGEGKIQLLKDFIEVEAFPQDLPHDIKVDISVIQKMGDTILIQDIKLSDKVTILDDLEQPILTVLRLTEEVEEAPVAAEVAP
jgi:large subunit ribosomal protein L25